jgi:histidyl-tRNA synthetase
MERLVMAIPAADAEPRCAIFLASLASGARDHALLAQQALRDAGVGALMDYEGRSLKSQMKRADKLGARYVAILGEDELAKGAWTVRDMKSSSQEQVGIDALAGHLVEKTRRG